MFFNESTQCAKNIDKSIDERHVNGEVTSIYQIDNSKIDEATSVDHKSNDKSNEKETIENEISSEQQSHKKHIISFIHETNKQETLEHKTVIEHFISITKVPTIDNESSNLQEMKTEDQIVIEHFTSMTKIPVIEIVSANKSLSNNETIIEHLITSSIQTANM